MANTTVTQTTENEQQHTNQDAATEGVTEYPILEFSTYDLERLSAGVHETLRYSEIKPGGGLMYRFLKRMGDIILSLLALIVLSIPMAVIALLVYLQDHGNPIFAQERMTKDGKIFRMYKFRSMCVDAEAKFLEVQKENDTDGLAFKNENDSRITPLGRKLRKTSLDELPQFWNVLKGDMSIIGPRPPLPREVVMYTPHYMQRLMVKGGLACICQCEGRSKMSFEQWMESDIRYIRERNLWLDIKLVCKIVIAVIQTKGAM